MLPKLSRGAFIVIEGCDKSGKSTQSRLLTDFLKSRNVPVVTEAFPKRTTPTGQIIDSYLTNKCDLPDSAIHLLFSINRWQEMDRLKKLLDEGTTLIVDRYAYSGVAYSTAKGMDMEFCKASDWNLVRPDVVFYLKTGVDSLTSKANFGDERYEKKEFQAKVSDVFDSLYETERDYWKLIDAGRDVDSVHKEIADATLKVIESVKESEIKTLDWKKK